MFSLQAIRAMNDAGTVREAMDKDESLIYTLDEVATDAAYEIGWRQDEDGRWYDEDGFVEEYPLDSFMHGEAPQAIHDAIMKAVNPDEED